LDVKPAKPALLCAAALLFSNPYLAAAGESIKAIVAHEYGPPDSVKYEDAPRPEPKENEALVRVIAAGVNPADPLVVNGKYAREFGTSVPLIPGYDIAGIVEKIGPAVTKFKVGDAIYGYPLMGGGWAQYCVVTETEAEPKPKSLSFVDASAVPLAALTAWQSLVSTAGLTSGQTVLIHGGAGGVGHFAVQIAKARGARVIATASTANQDLLRQLGVDVPIDYTKQKFEEIAKDVDVVLDTVGHDLPARTYPIVKKGGIICEIAGSLSKAELEKYGIRGAGISVKPDADDLAEITKLIYAGKIKPVVTQVLPLSEGAKACVQAETHHTRGKVVLKVADEPLK
jgi:NADPH:quinone reductase-like Zn-dependent oxidoreductase